MRITENPRQMPSRATVSRLGDETTTRRGDADIASSIVRSPKIAVHCVIRRVRLRPDRRLMPIDLVDLDLFARIAEAGSITHGARQAHLALPSASARVAN